MRIYIPFALLIAVLIGYWFMWQRAADEVREEVAEWIAEERAEGRIADYQSMRIHGFPYRLQVEFVAPRLGDPGLGWAWEADRMTGFVLPYNLNHIVIVAQGFERLEVTRLERREVVSGTPGRHRASLILRDGDLERFDFEVSDFELNRAIYFLDNAEEPERVEQLSGETFQFHTRRLRDMEGLPENGHNHAVVLEAANVHWEGHPYEGLGPDIPALLARVIITGLPESGIGSINDDILPGWHANDGELYVDEMGLEWDGIEFLATGEMRLDRRNRPNGNATILVGGHGRLIDALVAGGAMPGNYAELAKSALDVIAALGGDPEGRIRAPLRMQGGKLLIGPVEVANLPPLYRDEESE